MEDLGYRFQNLKKQHKDIIKIILVIFAVIIFIFIIVKIISIFNKKVPTENIPLIKGKEIIKIFPNQKEKTEQASLSIYDIVDKKNTDDNIIIKKNEIITKEIELSEIDFLKEQQLLAEKIDEVNNIKENKNIKIVKKQKTDIDDLKKLGNAKLIENIKKSKYIKPSNYKIQIAALKNRNTLLKYWNSLTEKYDFLKEQPYYIEQVSSDIIGLIYRLQLINFNTEKDANIFCEKYIKLTNQTKNDCLVIK
jgi:hypothetical protein